MYSSTTCSSIIGLDKGCYNITMKTITDSYLQRFPTGLRDFLKLEKNQKAFLDSIREDYEPVKVYRAIHCCKAVFERDFLNNFDDAKIFAPDMNLSDRLTNYSVSVNESLDMLKTSVKFPNKRKHLCGIAIGEMRKEYGPADFDEDRPHHNWYLFEGVSKHLVQLFEVMESEN